MEIIRLNATDHIDMDEIRENATAIGFFDGLHRGHLNVIKTMIKIAEEKQLKKAVMTFDPHPSVVLNPKHQRTTYLTPLEVKLEMLEEMGVDYVFVVNFSSKLAKLEPDEFVRNYIISMNVRELISGFDYTYGKKGQGNTTTLNKYSEFNMTTVGKYALTDEKISTTNIQHKLARGDLEQANIELGRIYTIRGVVVQGEKRGRTIGFPTANIEASYKYFLPKNGVYSVTLEVHSTGGVHKGVGNIGVKPTFHDDIVKPIIEVHLFDFNESIYGENVTIYFYHYLRPEVKYEGIGPLVEQMEIDREQAKKLLEDID
ncbi:bifunctional riboflavin kinase/FAD synthetase [Lacicoccus alkaliphilus]|uniref:Riboflavin biosynthesis protein n=1 Tax=Lacicoccus alkaliphilus DSM 16010 TaxID=1123231 RepID=A0A1M7C4A7_9BACL|nr:bifunctional riboflavin kinase/FAD synthetase [Salinicoccus alkaliphilus]SHL62041.1 riboflavin kinase / FMN adenylyltransferase [Salinicoccus alkaliphilus DSM 16010]